MKITIQHKNPHASYFGRQFPDPLTIETGNVVEELAAAHDLSLFLKDRPLDDWWLTINERKYDWNLSCAVDSHINNCIEFEKIWYNT